VFNRLAPDGTLPVHSIKTSLQSLGFKVVEDAGRAINELQHPIEICDMKKGAKITTLAVLRMQKIATALLDLADLNKKKDPEKQGEKVEQLNFEQYLRSIRTKLTIENLQAVFFMTTFQSGREKSASLNYDQIRELTSKTLRLDLNNLQTANTEDHLRAQFDEADIDGDENINFEEFIAFLQIVSGEHPNNPLIIKGQKSNMFKNMEGDMASMESSLVDFQAKQAKWEILFNDRQADFDKKRVKKKATLESRLKEFDELIKKLKERDGILSNASTDFLGGYKDTIDKDVKSMNELVDAYNAVRVARQTSRRQIHSHRTVFFKVFHDQFMNRDRYQQLLDLAKQIQQLSSQMAPTVRESQPLVLNRNKHWEQMAAAEVIPDIGLYDYDKCYSEISRGDKALTHYKNTVGAEDQKNTKSVEDMADKLRDFKVKQFDNVHLRMQKKQLNAKISKATATQKKIDLQLVMMSFELHDLNSDSREMLTVKGDQLNALAAKQQADQAFLDASNEFVEKSEELRRKRVKLQELQIELARIKLALPRSSMY